MRVRPRLAHNQEPSRRILYPVVEFDVGGGKLEQRVITPQEVSKIESGGREVAKRVQVRDIAEI